MGWLLYLRTDICCVIFVSIVIGHETGMKTMLEQGYVQERPGQIEVRLYGNEVRIFGAGVIAAEAFYGSNPLLDLCGVSGEPAWGKKMMVKFPTLS